MCLGAIYWARPDKIYYAGEKTDAAAVGFDDAFIYEEIGRAATERRYFTRQILRDEALEAFRRWDTKQDKIKY